MLTYWAVLTAVLLIIISVTVPRGLFQCVPMQSHLFGARLWLASTQLCSRFRPLELSPQPHYDSLHQGCSCQGKSRGTIPAPSHPTSSWAGWGSEMGEERITTFYTHTRYEICTKFGKIQVQIWVQTLWLGLLSNKDGKYFTTSTHISSANAHLKHIGLYAGSNCYNIQQISIKTALFEGDEEYSLWEESYECFCQENYFFKWIHIFWCSLMHSKKEKLLFFSITINLRLKKKSYMAERD